MTTLRRLLLFLLSLGASYSGIALSAPLSFSTIDVPGATGTTAYGINTAGQIVGLYTDSGNVTHGFVENGGVFSSMSVPGSTSTSARGINDTGQIVGAYVDASGGTHGYVESMGTFITIDVPGAQFTFAYGINDAAQIVGYYEDAAGHIHGFLYNGGSYSTVDAFASSYGTEAFGINDAGQIVGRFDGWGFLDTGGAFSGMIPFGVSSVSAAAINGAGQIVGYLAMQSNQVEVFRGFLYPGGSFSAIDVPGVETMLIDYPGATSTRALDNNDAGDIVGGYQDASGVFHGFLAVPDNAVPEPETLALLGLGLAGLAARRKRKRQ